MRLRILTGIAAAGMLAAPVPTRAEAFTVFWSALGPSEQDFVDEVAAGLYGEERGASPDEYLELNSASRVRYRMRAINILGVKNRPARMKTRGNEI